MNRMKTSLLGAALLASGACAQTDTILHGPVVPPHLRAQAPAQPPAASGAALQGQALQKLRQRFNQADLDANGKLTEEEAKSSGLGFIVANFAEIDSAGSGKVSFDDVKKFLAQRR